MPGWAGFGLGGAVGRGHLKSLGRSIPGLVLALESPGHVSVVADQRFDHGVAGIVGARWLPDKEEVPFGIQI